jgi:hypothetical protein
MTVSAKPSASAPQRDLQVMSNPGLWPTWPFLPLVRRRPGGAEELGLLFDQSVCGLTGHRCTVFIGNLFLLPRNLDAFLDLPREVYDTFEEVAAAGWGVD